jgi:uncharacterized RDD family membrane protein YckC
MRCPKCHYLSFEPEPRCRNCGYDLSGDPADLSLRVEESGEPIADLALRPTEEPPGRAAIAPASDPPAERATRDVPVQPRAAAVPFRRPGNAAASVTIEEPAPEPRPVPPAATSELPLFVKGMASSPPPPSSSPPSVPEPPRPPLAVQRRAEPAPKPPRPRPETGPRKPGPFDGDLLEDLQRIERLERGLSPTPPPRRESASAPATGRAAEPWRGLVAAALDAVFIGMVNVAIFWITLRWTNLAFVDASLLPALPLGTFLVLVALGYLLMFTAAGGQTLGKMIAGVRVVDAGDGSDQAISVQQAALRSVLAMSSVLMLGLGFLPALLGSGKSLHDRLAHTRIVRA